MKKRSEHGGAEHDAIGGEHAIAVRAHVAHHDRDREPSAHRRGEHAHEQRQRCAAGAQKMGNLEDCGGSDDRHAHEKAEGRRALAVERECTTGGDRGARARDPRKQRGRLRDADQERIRPANRLQRPRVGTLTIDDPEQQSHGRERDRDELRRAKGRLGIVVQEHARNPSGNRGDDEVEHASLLHRLHALRAHDLERGGDQLHPLVAEIDEHGDERAHVQRDIDRESRLRPAERPWRQREMRGARDRQKLGQSLQDAEDERLKDGHYAKVGVRETFMPARRATRPSRRPSQA